MKQKLTPRWLIIKLTGILFAIYSAYYIFLIIKDGKTFPREGIVISTIVALSFALLTVFAWTTEVKSLRFLRIRKTMLIITLLAIFALKLRMAGKVALYLDFSNLMTVLYFSSYFMTLAGMLVLFIYYTFILRNILLYPSAAVRFPLSAVILFAISFISEIIIFFVYGIGLEASPLRTMVMRPVFFLSLIGLSAYFLFPSPFAIPESPL